MKATERLRRMIQEGHMVRAMSAHNPLSARLVEEAGFDAIWASGFEFSASMGLPDISLVSMADHLAMTRAMVAACALPVIADIDTGFGNALNVMHAVREYERAGVSALVIEDKMFPKVTSLIEGGRQDLVRIEEFVGKIAAAREARTDPSLVLVARTEALIADQGMPAALERARAYAEAGADMILVHSKQKTSDEIETFISSWDLPQPLVLVPTSYPQMDEARARSTSRVGIYIYGNHTIRGSVKGMQLALAQIAQSGGALGAEHSIATVPEIFRLQRMDEVKRQEQAFLK